MIRISEHNTIAVHAGLLSGVTPEEMPMGVCVRCRWVTEDGKMAPSEHDERGRVTQPAGSVGWASRYGGLHHVIYGHAVWGLEWPRYDMFGSYLRLGVDTGCCYGGHLTAAVLTPGETVRTVRIKCRGDAHDEWYGP